MLVNRPGGMVVKTDIRPAVARLLVAVADAPSHE